MCPPWPRRRKCRSFDLRNELTDRPELFWDTGHLNRNGAEALAPLVADIAR